MTELGTLLHLLEQAEADTLSIARTVATSAENQTLWDEQFRSRWKELARSTADAVDANDPAALEAVGRELADFVSGLGDDTLPRRPGRSTADCSPACATCTTRWPRSPSGATGPSRGHGAASATPSHRASAASRADPGRLSAHAGGT